MSFRLAELELATGTPDDARARLRVLVHGADEQLAEDAAALLARTSSAKERADVWADYARVATGERRARAKLEEARSRAAAGDDAGARRAAHAVCALDAPDACAAASRFLK